MGKVEANKLQKERSLLDTAYELFTTKGIAKTSISDIAERANVAKGTFYLYFQDKYDLQNRLIVRKAEYLFDHALEHSDYRRLEDPVDRVLAIIEDILDQISQNPNVLRFISKNLSWGIFQKAMSKSEMDYIGIFQQMLERTELSREEMELLIYTVTELVGSSCHSVILEKNPTDIQTFKPYLYRSVRAILESFPGAGEEP